MKVDGAGRAKARTVTATGIGSIALLGLIFVILNAALKGDVDCAPCGHENLIFLPLLFYVGFGNISGDLALI